VRVHPEFLDAQKLPERPPLDELWQQRYESIRTHEQHLARNGIVVVKFWLNVSKEEQRKRFLARIEEPGKNWKFRAGDVDERAHWDQYMAAYQDALRATSRPWAPWYAIPADKKAFMRVAVADIIVRTMKQMNLRYPELSADDRRELEKMRELLSAQEE
jgi:polyphosphate kinase 2 (PPK2 family)